MGWQVSSGWRPRRFIALAGACLGAPLALAACNVQIGGQDQGQTVTQSAPTVTEREIIKKPPRTETQQQTVQQSQGGTVDDAVARVQSEGYDVEDRSTYDSSYTLRVLIGIRQGSATGFAQRAFFFVGDDYIGTDTSADSAHIEYAGQEDTTVSLTYDLYRPDDPNCCPTAGKATVSYELNPDRESLTPLDQIPSDSLGARESRR